MPWVVNGVGSSLLIVGTTVCLLNVQVAARTAGPTQEPPYSAAKQQDRELAQPFVSKDFKVPVLAVANDFRLVPLGPELVRIDFEAYMSSIEHLQKTFTRSVEWPHEGISDADALHDMEAEQARFQKRSSFAYSVLTKDGRRERGSVYVAPSTVAGYDAVVRLWVTKAEYDAGFDAKLFQWVTAWMRKEWPFTKVAYPGRSIPWDRWDSLVAAGKTTRPTAPATVRN